MGSLHFSRQIWRKTVFTTESQNSHQIGKPGTWQGKKNILSTATFSRSIPPAGEVRERVMERTEGRERRSVLHCSMEYELTGQHFPLVFSVDVCFQCTEMNIQAVPVLDKPISWQKGRKERASHQ